MLKAAHPAEIDGVEDTEISSGVMRHEQQYDSSISRYKNSDGLTELLRQGARRLIHEAVEAELEAFLEQHRERHDKAGRQAIVRNGYLPEREVLSGVGPVSVKVPRVA